MTNKEKKHLQKVSRLLAMVLRHAPDELGISLNAEGWVDVPTLLTALKDHDLPISLEQLETIVATNDKKRFTLSVGSDKIRAAQGHSIPVDLGVVATHPPDQLFHGTAQQNVSGIMQEGLTPQARQQVHMSELRAAALKVGQRHGEPVILTVNAAAMHGAGHLFYRAANGVWLTDHVPTQFLQLAE